MSAPLKKSQIVAAMKAALVLYNLDLLTAIQAREIVDRANGFEKGKQS